MSETNWETAFDSTDPEQRRLVVSTFARTSGSDAVAFVIRALGDDDWRVRKEAIGVVVDIGPSPELLDALIATFSNSDDVGLRNAVSEALAGFGRPAVQRIAAEMATLDADGRKLAAEALGRTGHPSAIAVLGALLRDADANVRVAAIEALGGVGGARTDEVAVFLATSLRSPELLERLAALDAINALGIALDWSELVSSVGVPVLERAALTAATKSDAADVAELLVQAMNRQAAFGEIWPVEVLAEYVSSSPISLLAAKRALTSVPQSVKEFLFNLTESEEFDVRSVALIVLAALGDEAASRRVLDAAERDEEAGVADHLIEAMAGLDVGVLKTRLRGTDPVQRALVLRIAARFPSTLAPDLILAEVMRALEEGAEPVLSAALEVLATHSNEECLSLLVRQFVALPMALRRTAMVVLGEMAARHPETARSVIDLTKFTGEEWIASTVLVGALARSGYPMSQLDMEQLTRCLSADSAAVRCSALEALAETGDAAAADAIAFSLTDEELEVRLAAVRALGSLRGDGESAAIIGRLIDLAQRTDDRELLVVAVQAIGETSDPRALTGLRPLVRSPEPSVAVAAVEAIARVKDARRLESLIDGLSHQDVDVVKSAMQMLVRENDVRVEAHLGACLDHDSWGVRRLAADLLGQKGGEVAAALLRAKRATEREPLVKEALERALSFVEGTAPTRRSSPAPGQGSWRPR